MALIDTLEPNFKLKVQSLLDNLIRVTGCNWIIVQARRTIAEQNALYAKGRTTKGEIVTNAKGGQSAHNFGLAVDLCPCIKGSKYDLDWNAPDATWKELADLAEGVGLTAGYYFKSIHDAPHVEDPSWKAVQAEWKQGKIKIA